MSLSDKLRKLKETQQERVNESREVIVDAWGTTLKMRSLTAKDEIHAETWAKKNFPKKSVAVTGCALLCLSILDDELPLEIETVDFLLGEPVDVLKALLEAVKQSGE